MAVRQNDAINVRIGDAEAWRIALEHIVLRG
jgi:hypothetical protein